MDHVQLPPPSTDAQPVKIVRRGPIIAVTVATAVVLVVIGQFVMGGSTPPGYDASGYDGATAVTLEPGHAATVAAAEKFHATDWRFRAAFPIEPKRRTEALAVPNIPHPVEVVAYESMLGSTEFSVQVYPLSGGAVMDHELVHELGARELGGRLASSHATTFQGYRGAEGLWVGTDYGDVRVLTFATADRVFLVSVAAERDPSTEFQQFRDSVEIL